MKGFKLLASLTEVIFTKNQYVGWFITPLRGILGHMVGAISIDEKHIHKKSVKKEINGCRSLILNSSRLDVHK